MLVYTIQVVILVMMSHLRYSCCISQSPYVPQHPCLPCWHPLSTCQGWPPSEAYISHQPKDTVTPDSSQMNDEGWWMMMNNEWWWMMINDDECWWWMMLMNYDDESWWWCMMIHDDTWWWIDNNMVIITATILFYCFVILIRSLLNN